MNTPLGQRICLAIETFMVDNAMYFIFMGLVIVVVLDFYNRFLRINRDWANMDITDAWSRLQLRRRYKL